MTPENPYANDHVSRWGRHSVIMVLIIAMVMGMLMWVNESQFTEERMTWQDYLVYLDQPELDVARPVTPEAERLKPTHTLKRQSDGSGSTVVDPQLTQINTQPITSKDDDPINFKGFSVVGVARDIDLSDAAVAMRQVNELWQRFSNEEALHEAQHWLAGSNTVYAYYYHFNREFTQARLVIGYQGLKRFEGTVLVNVKSGSSQSYSMDASGLLPDQVWNDAYPNGRILEQYSIDISGQPSNGRALVIK